MGQRVTPNKALLQTGHANDGFSCFNSNSPMSWLLSCVFG